MLEAAASQSGGDLHFLHQSGVLMSFIVEMGKPFVISYPSRFIVLVEDWKFS